LHLTTTFVAYGLGAAIGFVADRGGPRIKKDWPIYLRIQFLASAAAAGLFSAWGLTAPRQIVAPLIIAGTGFILLGASYVTRRAASGGQSALEAWAAYPNTAFWVLPIAEALTGSAGARIATLSNAAYSAPGAAAIHLLRRDAPHPQRRATFWIDQSSVLAVVVGLFLHLAGPAPEASKLVLMGSGPALAFVGAALFVGSVLHPHNDRDPDQPSGVARWAALTVVRVACLVPLALFTSSKDVAVVAMLCAFGPPAFNPSQLAVLYRYRSNVVYAAARWSWVLLPVGFAIAVAIR